MTALEHRTQALLDLVEADCRQKCDAILAEAQVAPRAAGTGARRRPRRGCARPSRKSARARMRGSTRRARTCRPGAGLPSSSARPRSWPPAGSGSRRNCCGAGATRSCGSAGSRRSSPVRARRCRGHVARRPCPRLAGRGARCRPRRARGGAGGRVRFEADPRLRAGLRISADGNVVDGTLDGLLADRADIGAQLLHHGVDDAAGRSAKSSG